MKMTEQQLTDGVIVLAKELFPCTDSDHVSYDQRLVNSVLREQDMFIVLDDLTQAEALFFAIAKKMKKRLRK
jgi:hypothetical protein